MLCLKKDVAAVTPDMEVLPSGQGSISTNGGHNLEYHSGGLAKLKSKGVDIWAEGASDIRRRPQHFRKSGTQCRVHSF